MPSLPSVVPFLSRPSTLVSLLRDDGGATLVEYSLLVALIAGVCIAVITTLGGKVRGIFTALGSKMPSAIS